MAVTALPSFDPKSATPLDWALMYRAVGLNVVPAYYPDEPGSKGSWKRPHITSWQEYTKIWVPDRQVENWWGPNGLHQDRCQMGVVTGSGSGNLLVVDLDIQKDQRAEDWYRKAMKGHFPATKFVTPVQKTGGGGYQVLFRAPEGWIPPTNKTSIGVDIRGEGGFAMLPPSKHDSGGGYHWLADRTPWNCPIMEAPPELVAAINDLTNAEKSGIVGKSREKTPDPEGQFSPFGQRIDGREDYMARVVFASVVDLYREMGGVRPSELEVKGRAQRAYTVYESKVAPRIVGALHEKGELLDREGRGPAEFWSKYQHTMRQWDGKVAEAAKEAPPRSSPFGGVTSADTQRETADDTGDAPPAPPLRATPFEWVDPTKIRPRGWVYGRHYIRKFISTTVAPGGVGKTALGVVEALSIVTGKPLLGIVPDEQVRVWLWNGEDPLEEMQRRIMASALHYGLNPADVSGLFFVDTGRQTPIIIAEKTRDGAVINAPLVQQVIDTILENQIGVMIVDPFVACHRVTENDNSEIERVAKAWAHIADQTNCAIELVHHVRKTNGNEISVEDGRGAVALLAAARSARALNRMSADEAAKAGVGEPGLYFRTDNGKANLAPPSSAAAWHFLASVDLRNATEATSTEPARPSDKVGVVTRWEWPDPASDVTVGDLHNVRAAVGARKWREDSQAADWVGYAILAALGIEVRDEAAKAKAKGLQKMWTENKALEVYEDLDENRKRKKFVRPGPFKDD